MDTAQRGMGLDWAASLELVRRTLDAARDVPGAFVASGAGTDYLAPAPGLKIEQVIAAYEQQCAAIEKLGGRIILMASRALAACARTPDDYARVYDRLLSQVKEPVIIHWLGEMFDPALAGYWGEPDHYQAMQVCLEVLRRNAAKVDGIKISLLDKDKEIAMRRQLPAGVRMYTGDDFNFAELIEGDEQAHSDALLGIFDSIAPAGLRCAVRPRRQRPRRLPRDSCAHRAAVTAHLPLPHPLLQNGGGVHGLAQRPSGALRDGPRSAERAPSAAFRRAVPAGGCGGVAGRSGAGLPAHAAAAGRARHRLSGGCGAARPHAVPRTMTR
jgi:hypothetical protein